MIAPAKETQLRHAWQRDFLVMLPTIQQHAHFTFRALPLERREEAVQQVVVGAFRAFVRLAKLGRVEVAYATPLARYAAAQVRSGRQVGMKQNVNDVLSRYGQTKKGFRVERLDHFDEVEGEWKELVVEDRTAGPAEIAATRIDVAAWLDSQRMADASHQLLTADAQARRELLEAQGRLQQQLQEQQAEVGQQSPLLPDRRPQTA